MEPACNLSAIIHLTPTVRVSRGRGLFTSSNHKSTGGMGHRLLSQTQTVAPRQIHNSEALSAMPSPLTATTLCLMLHFCAMQCVLQSHRALYCVSLQSPSPCSQGSSIATDNTICAHDAHHCIRRCRGFPNGTQLHLTSNGLLARA